MNEKLKNLAEQSGYLPGFRFAMEDFDLERFAELIVEECQQFNMNQSYELSGVISDVENAEFDDICLNTVKRVEQYLSGNDLKNTLELNEISPMNLKNEICACIGVVAPTHQIPAEFFESYKPFFTAIHNYQSSVIGVDDGDLKSLSNLQITAALLGMANLMAALVPAPSPMFLEDGTIGGYWRRNQYYVSIDFEVDGEHTWVSTNGEKFQSGTWKLPGNQMPISLSQELHYIIRTDA